MAVVTHYAALGIQLIAAQPLTTLTPTPDRQSLLIHPIPVARRLRDHQETNRTGRRISDLMPHSRQNSNPASSWHQGFLSIDFHKNFAIEHIEELLGMHMVVANLGRSGGHKFLNYGQIPVTHQVPAVAVDSPAIVLGVFPADSCWLRRP